MKRNVCAMFVIAALSASPPAPSAWPPFLPPAASFSPDVAADVERVWSDPTLSRSVEGKGVAVPVALYLAFIDSPDVTAAAARHLKLAKYEVRLQSDGVYAADDQGG